MGCQDSLIISKIISKYNGFKQTEDAYKINIRYIE
jgi:hypothetical protein